MRLARSFLLPTLVLAAPLALAACESRGPGFLTQATSPGAGQTVLTSLTLSSGTLNPAFSAAVTSYTATVPNATNAISVTPTAANSLTLTVNGSAVSSGSPAPIVLAEGANTIVVNVANSAGQSAEYTITVTREAGTP